MDVPPTTSENGSSLTDFRCLMKTQMASPDKSTSDCSKTDSGGRDVLFSSCLESESCCSCSHVVSYSHSAVRLNLDVPVRAERGVMGEDTRPHSRGAAVMRLAWRPCVSWSSAECLNPRTLLSISHFLFLISLKEIVGPPELKKEKWSLTK